MTRVLLVLVLVSFLATTTVFANNLDRLKGYGLSSDDYAKVADYYKSCKSSCNESKSCRDKCFEKAKSKASNMKSEKGQGYKMGR